MPGRLAAGAIVLLSCLLVACSAPRPAPQQVPVTASTSARPVVDPVAAEQALLDARAQAVRTHDLGLFLRGDDPRQPAFIARDRALFAALTALSWSAFDYRITSTPWPKQLLDPDWGPSARLPQVVFTSQLAAYDTQPSSRITGFAFVTRAGRTYIASDRTVHDHLFPGYQPDPWDVAPVTVIAAPSVLGVFDAGALAKSRLVMTDAARAVATLAHDVPYAWTKNVVVFGVQGDAFPDALIADTGGDLSHLGAMTYALPPPSQEPDNRVVLLAGALASDPDTLARIIRHEVTHVALGTEQTGVPLWLVEGIAEYEGAQAIPAAKRKIPAIAIQRSKAKSLTMPASGTFHDADQDWHYALSWMACEYIVKTGGESLLWALLDAMNNGGLGTTDAHQDLVLQQVLGMKSSQLAARAAALIQSTYG